MVEPDAAAPPDAAVDAGPASSCDGDGAPDDHNPAYVGHVERARYSGDLCPDEAPLNCGTACCPADLRCAGSGGGWHCASCADGDLRHPCDGSALEDPCDVGLLCADVTGSVSGGIGVCTLPCSTDDECAPMGPDFCCRGDLCWMYCWD